MTPGTLLKKAADWFEDPEHPWCQGHYCWGLPTKPEACCIEGVLRFIAGGDARNGHFARDGDSETIPEFREDFIGAMGLLLDVTVVDVVYWNDFYCCTKYEAIDALRKAAGHVQ